MGKAQALLPVALIIALAAIPSLCTADDEAATSAATQVQSALAKQDSALKTFLANPADKDARDVLVSEYRKSAPDKQSKVKNALQEEYYRRIRTDSASAKLCRDLYATLVGIASSNLPIFSYAVGVQMPTGFPPEKYAIGKGKPSQLVADEIMIALGSDILKLAPGAKQLEREGIEVESNKTLDKMVTQPVYKKILDLPYRVMFFWAHGGSGDNLHTRSMTKQEKDDLYKEFFEFTKYLLTAYNNTGKTFMIGNWEGDWMAGGKEVGNDKSLEDARVRSFAEWLDIRTKAIDDAKAKTSHKNVFVYSYLEINHVNRARTARLKRLVNSVLPYSRVDYVSISSYEMQGFGYWQKAKTEAAMRDKIFASLNYVQDNLPPRDIPGKRVLIGEIGYTTENIQRANKKWSKEQVQQEQARLALLDAKLNLEWGTPFWLWWSVHDTKGGGFGIVDQNTGDKTVLYNELKKYYQWADEYTKQYRKDKGTLPSPDVFRAKAIEKLGKQAGELFSTKKISSGP